MGKQGKDPVITRHPSRVGLGTATLDGAMAPYSLLGTDGCGCGPGRGHCMEGKWPQSQVLNANYVPGSV